MVDITISEIIAQRIEQKTRLERLNEIAKK